MEGIADVFGVQDIHWNGMSYSVPRPNFDSERDMKTALQRAYYETELKAQKMYMMADDFDRSMRNFQQWCNSGYWSFGKEGFSTALADEANMVEILYIVLKQEGQIQLDKKQVHQMIKDKADEATKSNEELLAREPDIQPGDPRIKASEVVQVINNWFKGNPTTPPGVGEKAKS